MDRYKTHSVSCRNAECTSVREARVPIQGVQYSAILILSSDGSNLSGDQCISEVGLRSVTKEADA
jgi:hypothetical protein